MTYDALNRVVAAAVAGGPWASLNMGWSYDAFGNRTSQTLSGNPQAPAPQSQAWDYTAGNRNQATIIGYDAAGNVINDGINQYAYDAEGRVCAVYNVYGGFTQYLYDAEGRRVGKATLGAQSLPLTSAACSPSAAGLTVTASYLLDLSGRQASELDGSGNFLRGQAYANGQLLASYTNSGTHFALSDWLGTKRVVANADGSVAGTCLSLPFGDELICTGDASQRGHHFTGKVRDSESGNDYFGARYYANTMGRFLSPDSGADATLGVPVPFAELENPQSLDLYSYVRNSPLSLTDPDGQNVRVCADNGSGGQNCVNLTDGQYKNLHGQQNGQQGINLPGGSMPGGNITCGGQVCGSAHFYEPGLEDESGSELIGIAGGMAIGKAVDAVAGAVAGLFGRGAGEAVSGAAAQGGAKVLLSGGTKQAAKDVIEGLADGAQKASARRAVAAATRSESVSISESADGTLTVTRTRPGFDGYQTFTKTIDPSGNSSTLQTAHDAAGNLVHYDPKY